VAARFPVDTPEFEAIAAAYRAAKTDEEAEEARGRLATYAGPYVAVFRLKGALAPKQDRRGGLRIGYSRYRVAIAKIAVQAMEEQ
jgi:hypothetical protein